MKKIIFLLALALLLYSCSDDTTNPSGSTVNFPFDKNYTWLYSTFEVDANGDKGEKFAEHTVELGVEETLDGKSAYEIYKYIDSEKSEDELFTHIGEDEDGIYLYVGKLDLNNFQINPNTETKIPIIFPGWIKIYDYNQENWESFFVEIDQAFGQDTVRGKIEITGDKQGSRTINLDGEKTVQIVNMKFNIDARIATNEQTIGEQAISNIRIEFLDGIGIYSIQYDKNTLMGIDKSYIEELVEYFNKPLS